MSTQLTRSGPVNLSHNVRHAGLVSHECRQVDGLRRIILRERLHFATLSTTALLRQKAQRSVPRRRKLAMRLYAQTQQKLH